MTAPIIHVQHDDLAALDVLAVNQVQLLVFSATWCGPCRAMAPVIDDVATTYAGEVVVAKVDIEQSPAIARAFEVRGVPTLIVRRGANVERHIGVLTRTRLAMLLDDALEQGEPTA